MQTPTTRYAKSGEVRVAYQVVGHGPVDLVFVPGFISNLEIHWEHPGYAHLLQRLGTFARVAAPEVFEQAPELLDVGAAIAVWPNALRILRRLGVGAQVLTRAGVIEQVRWLSWDGRALKRVRFPVTDTPAVALHRADLQSALLHALPASSIHLDRVCESYQPAGDKIHARFADGATVACDLLIGADGLHSLVARNVQAVAYNATPTLTCAYYTYFSDVPMEGAELYPRPDQMIVAGPTNDGQTLVIVFWPHAAFHEVRADIEGNFLMALELAPELKKRQPNDSENC